MKTTKNMKTLKRLTVTASAVIILGTALLANPNAGNNAVADAANRLDNLASSIEKNIMYQAPDATVTDAVWMERENTEIGKAMENLELLAGTIENDLLYLAYNEVETVIAHEQLEKLNSAIEADLVYLAPAADVAEDVEASELLAQNF
jgi:hypothetical protein